MPRRQSLSADEARRAILAAQGFATRDAGGRLMDGAPGVPGTSDGPGTRRGSPASAATDADSGPAGSAADEPSARRIVATVRQLGLVQIDSVNILARAHYLPLFSRLGGYDRTLLDRAAARRPRTLFEYWGHEASLLPVTTQPLLRWRMAQEHPWRGVAETMRHRTELVEPLLAAIREFGPVTASQLEAHLEHDEPRPATDWGWNWSVVKQLVEGLFWSGAIGSAGRDSGFRRRYDLAERVLPPGVLQGPTPTRAEAIAGLTRIAARALGVATLADLRDYFRLPAADTRSAVAVLVEAGELEPVSVAGWSQQAFRPREARIPRRVDASALLVPFDPLIWFRERVERVFGMRYRIEIYTPAHKREFGYYVLPFLLGDRLVARVDLRADRRAGRLVVVGAWRHEASDRGVRPVDPDDGGADPDALAAELAGLAGWLRMTEVAVDPNGDLARDLEAAISRLR